MKKRHISATILHQSNRDQWSYRIQRLRFHRSGGADGQHGGSGEHSRCGYPDPTTGRDKSSCTIHRAGLRARCPGSGDRDACPHAHSSPDRICAAYRRCHGRSCTANCDDASYSDSACLPASSPKIIADQNTNCRVGPDTDYAIQTYFMKGAESTVKGRDEGKTGGTSSVQTRRANTAGSGWLNHRGR